jgi:hypothetical protein
MLPPKFTESKTCWLAGFSKEEKSMNEPHNNSVLEIWQSQPVEVTKMSLEVLRKRASKLEHRVWWRNTREYVASLGAAVLLAYFFATTHDLLSRAAFGLFFLGLLWMMVQLHRKGSAKTMPTGVDTLSSLNFYRVELERQRELVASVWSWYLAPLVPGFIVYTIGHAIRSPHPAAWAGLALLDASVALAFFFIWKLNMRTARCLDRMIHELKGTK